MLSDNTVTSFILQCFVICAIIYYILFIYKNRRFFKFSWNNNGFFVPVLPIVGHLYLGFIFGLFNGLRISPISCSPWAKKWFGHPLSFWVCCKYYYATSNPTEIKIILNHSKCYNKGDAYEPLKFLFNNSVVLADYKEWKLKRRYFQSGFTPNVLKRFVPTFYEESCKLLTDIQMMNKSDDILHLFSKHSFSNFFLTSAGLGQENYESDMKQIGIIISRLQENLVIKFLFPFIPFYLWVRFVSSGKKLLLDKIKLKSIVGKIIAQKRNQHCNAQGNIDADKTISFLDLLIKDSKNFSDHDIFKELSLFTGAATETSATALSFCFTLLGMHPLIQKTLYKEVLDQVGFNDILNDDLPNLKYTEAVILETLRLIPPVPFIARRAVADIDLGDKVIPNGNNILIDIFHVQRDEKYWPDPLKFDPTRFLPVNILSIKPYTFLPFSAGPRDCIGKAQAITMLKITVANVIRKYKVTSKYKSVDDFVLTSTISLKNEEPLDCQFILRLEK